jgi:hypothetical protein
MPSKQNQHYLFSYRALPALFHSQTQDFFKYLKKDRTKFLLFWWEHVIHAHYLHDKSMHVAPDGLNFEIRTYKDGREIALIILPTPKASSEAYFLGLVPPPLKKNFFPWKNLARVFSLELRVGKSGSRDTLLGEWTPRGNHVVIGDGPKPDIDDFFKVVCEQIAKG